jgi:acylphosphatase
MNQPTGTLCCIRCLISGRVQGVFYRASAQRKAEALGLAGWVRNLPDGRVEVLASGSEDALKELQGWLWQGPPHAAVTGVQCEPAQHPATNGFEVR